jgi:hypothetical protein
VVVVRSVTENLAELWSKLSLSKEEGIDVEVIDDEVEEIAAKGQSCLVSNLIADRVIGNETIRSRSIKGWRPTYRISSI